MNMLFWSKVRMNPVVRTVCIPGLRMIRKAEQKKYRNTDDFKYIKAMKNSCNGERCFIIGNGPSLTREDLNLLINEKTFAFNCIYRMYPYTDWRPTYYMALDMSVQQTMMQEKQINFGAGSVFFSNKKLVQRYKKQNAHKIFLSWNLPIHREKVTIESISEDVSICFSSSHSVSINAIEFAFYMGFKEIYLLGIDHQWGVEIDMNGHKHINKGIAAHFKEDKDKSAFFGYAEALTKCYEVCKKYADKHGIKIINVTRGGKLEVFERDTLENVLQRC